MFWFCPLSITTRFDNNCHYLRGNKGNFEKSESEDFNRPIKNCFAAICAWGERVKITTFITCFSSLSSFAACFLSATASYRLICWCLSFVCGTYSFGGDNFECSQPGRKPRNFSYLGCKLVTHKKFFIHALRIKFCKFLSFEGKCVSMSAPFFPSFSPSSTISSTCCWSAFLPVSEVWVELWRRGTDSSRT